MATIANPTFQDRAVELLGRGFSLIPLQPSGKAPLRGIGANSKTKDPAVIQSWAEQFPQANVGVVADKDICILESDDLGALRTVVKNSTGKDLPQTLSACGSSENRPHFFFKHTEKSRNIGCLQVPGLFEARFVNQYVVAPGSIHPDGHLYRWLNNEPIVEIPDWLVSELARLALTQKIDRKNPIVAAGPDGKIPEGGRHYAIMRYLGKEWTGAQDFEELLESAKAFNERYCEPPKDDGHIQQCVRDIMKRTPYDPGPKVILSKPEPGNASAEPIRANGGHFDFVLSPPTDGIDGAFALGSVHLIFGSSGTGKSTLGLQMLRAQAAGQPFFGHASFGRRYLYCMKDRGRHETARTFARLQVDDSVPVAQIVGGVNWQKAAHSIKQKFLEAGQPEVVFIEGLDMCLEEPNNPSQVGQLMEALMDLADRYHVSIIGTVGAPKLKRNEQYSPRDGMFGSSFWARKADTMVRVTENFETGLRDVILMYRNSAQEKFSFRFTGGQMEPCAAVVEDEPEDRSKVDEFAFWASQQEAPFQRKQVSEKFGEQVSIKTIDRWLKDFSKRGGPLKKNANHHPPTYFWKA